MTRNVNVCLQENTYTGREYEKIYTIRRGQSLFQGQVTRSSQVSKHIFTAHTLSKLYFCVHGYVYRLLWITHRQVCLSTKPTKTLCVFWHEHRIAENKNNTHMLTHTHIHEYFLWSVCTVEHKMNGGKKKDE